MIYVGIDDTDVKGSPGTNKLARFLIGKLHPHHECVLAVRHQLLFDPRVPYTSKNSSASIILKSSGSEAIEDLKQRIRPLMAEWFVEGSDPGLCITETVPDEITVHGRRCQTDVVPQADAVRLAQTHGIYLEGLGGTNDGVIGALAAVGLMAEGNDGRVVNIGNWPDDLTGPLEVDLLHSRGVDEIRVVESSEIITVGTVDIGKHLRPSYRGGKIVLFVKKADEETSSAANWNAVRFA